MDPAVLELLFPVLGFAAFVAGGRRVILGWTELEKRAFRATGALIRRVIPSREMPQGRPIECIAADARRIGSRFHTDTKGQRFAKVEGIRMAYDRVLTEACDALGIPHLLAVLPPGLEADAERQRVERVLGEVGLDLPEAA